MTKEKTPRDECVCLELTVSVGLAQFLTQINMTAHESYQHENENHQAILKEFIELKRSIRADLEPIEMILAIANVLAIAEEMPREEDTIQ